MAGSLLMLASIIVFGLSEGSFDIIALERAQQLDLDVPRLRRRVRRQGADLPLPRLAPGSYREAPAEVAGVLSGAVSKAAAYGFLYVAIVHFPEPTSDLRTPILVLAAIGLIYGSLLRSAPRTSAGSSRTRAWPSSG